MMQKHLFTLTESIAKPQAAVILQLPADLLILTFRQRPCL